MSTSQADQQRLADSLHDKCVARGLELRFCRTCAGWWSCTKDAALWVVLGLLSSSLLTHTHAPPLPLAPTATRRGTGEELVRGMTPAER